MRHLVLPSVLSVACLFALGCQSADPALARERVDGEQSPIINGSLDDTHDAVVAVLGNDFECSGTVIQVKATTGYVLTAGHCCVPGKLPSQVIVGPDYTSGESHPIVAGSVLADPCYLDYAGSPDDVCLLKFKNAAGVPVIPPMTPQTDDLAIGTPITYVGYGITAAPPGGNNSHRRFVDKTIGNVDTYLVDYADPGASGTCEGDSGGPGLVVVNGQEQVASVTSFGDKSCHQLGASTRTSTIYAGFIAPYLADQTPAPSCPIDTDCNVCSANSTQNGGCVDVTQACLTDPDCSALVDCYQACSSQTCRNACNTAHTAGLGQYAAIESCFCGECPSACGKTSVCVAPKCGLKVADATCASCIEASCCAEAWACATDATCTKCFGASPPPGCATSAKATAYAQCAKTSCACAVPDPTSTGATTGASTSAATTGSGDAASSGDPATSGAGVGGGAATTSGAGVGGGGEGGGDDRAGGCGCSTIGDASLPPAGLGGLALAALAALARRRRWAS